MSVGFKKGVVGKKDLSFLQKNENKREQHGRRIF